MCSMKDNTRNIESYEEYFKQVLCFSKVCYYMVKAQAEAKATGANIHRVSNCLSTMLNGVVNYCYWVNNGCGAYAEESRAMVEKALAELQKTIGIAWKFEYFLTTEKDYE